jgi:hypothetical protein
MKRLIIIAPAITLIAACSGGGGDQIQAGQWEMVTQMTSVEAPGAPEAVVQQMRSQMASQRQTQSVCITPEQARNPSRNMMGGQNPAGCEFTDTTWAGGNVKIRATCRPPGAPPTMRPVEMSIEGTYTAQQINNRITVTTEISNPTGAGAPIRINAGGTMTGRRTGDCRS